MSQELVVDADGHVMEADDLWVERMDHRRGGDWIPRKTLEAERAIVDLGLKGVTVRLSPYDELPLNHSVYDPFSVACQELDIPVAR